MDILVVEDDEVKRSRIISFLEETLDLTRLEIAKSFQSGMKAIVNNDFRLIILDMTMPTFDINLYDDGGRPQAFAGREILFQMKRRKIYTPVIIVTQFHKFGENEEEMTINELNNELINANLPMYKGIVYYNNALEGWKEDLSILVNHI
ncbi:response regulator [Hymenobacter cheonanensis]|uniref:response regulator n=1 Tax=Hymenobacter sp. CA2-7 TaxID=3063993 RepID=UPI0027125ACF|nr:response regulator [Hymenobacter sp. CA2-7]MDO7887608.1 response regulator [Hymenobacter sp. CA2-7]